MADQLSLTASATHQEGQDREALPPGDAPPQRGVHIILVVITLASCIAWPLWGWLDARKHPSRGAVTLPAIVVTGPGVKPANLPPNK